jgi:hypothetical protein
MDQQTMDTFFQDLFDRWPSPFVLRSQIGEFSCGLISPSSMATMDSRNTGPSSIRMGKRLFYGKADLIKWMKRRFADGAARWDRSSQEALKAAKLPLELEQIPRPDVFTSAEKTAVIRLSNRIKALPKE